MIGFCISPQMAVTSQTAAEPKPKGPEEEMLSSFFGGEIEKELPGEILFIFNIKALGDSITDNGDASNHEIKKAIKYRVTEISENDVKLIFTGSEITKRKQTMQGVEILVTGENRLSGELTVDKKSGIIKHKITQIDGNGNSEMMSQSIPFTIKQTVTSSTQ